MKQFYISNQKIDKQIAEIKQKIKLSMNGVVSDSMKMSGIIYTKNYGVSITRLKEIAKNYEPNHDLAQRLWMLKIRESMILATLLTPIEKFKHENLKIWSSEINNIELVEQCCMNLFCKLNFANDICTNFINSKDIWHQTIGFTLSARIYKILDINEINSILQKAFENIKSEEYIVIKSIALCLSRFCRINTEIQTKIQENLNQYKNQNILWQNYIVQEIQNEILFLNN